MIGSYTERSGNTPSRPVPLKPEIKAGLMGLKNSVQSLPFAMKDKRVLEFCLP